MATRVIEQLEMECPKILWLKKRMDPTLFSRCQFFDLPDFLTYRATSSDIRSSCSLTCKFSYIPDNGWRADFFQKIGLGEFVERDYEPVGGNVLTAGMPVGHGLCKKAAQELGLAEGTPVGSALIDACVGPLLLLDYFFNSHLLAMRDGWGLSLRDTPTMERYQTHLLLMSHNIGWPS